MIVTWFFTGCLYHNIKSPGPISQVTAYTLNSEDYKILGKVEAEGKIKTWFLLFSTGGNGYSELYAKSKAMGGDDVINYVFELESYGWFLIIYNEASWKAYGTAIQYTAKVKK